MTELEDLPGSEFVLQGIKDIQSDRADTLDALLVSIASERLRGLGLDIPLSSVTRDAELALYQRLGQLFDDPYNQYNARLQRLVSFCNALEHWRSRQAA